MLPGNFSTCIRSVAGVSLLFVALHLSPCSAREEALPGPRPRGLPMPLRAEQPQGAFKGGPVDAEAMLAAHNAWRAEVNSPALTWSRELAATAQAWADRLSERGCMPRHSKNGFGENIFFASPRTDGDGNNAPQYIGPKEVVDSWGSERENYDYSTDTCTGICGHYTQLVWRETEEVGCAVVLCADKAQIWVCSYSPRGNTMDRKPY